MPSGRTSTSNARFEPSPNNSAPRAQTCPDGKGKADRKRRRDNIGSRTPSFVDEPLKSNDRDRLVGIGPKIAECRPAKAPDACCAPIFGNGARSEIRWRAHSALSRWLGPHKGDIIRERLQERVAEAVLGAA